VPVGGGRVEQLLTTPAEDVKVSRNGQFLIYHAWENYQFAGQKGFQNLMRHRIRDVLGDVSIEDDVKNMVDVALKRFDSIDILVNNAGINIRGPSETYAIDSWDTVMHLGRKPAGHGKADGGTPASG
jgi:NAD(P)-dependent dehydrogenase (short-subunit alcohol dehydrogenase family)